MTCFYCKGSLKQSTTTHVVNLNECIIIVKNVPCLECEQCGEKVYTDEVQAKLEKIIRACESIVTELTIVNYTDKVA